MSPRSGGACGKALRGEIAAHLGFGMLAGQDAAIDLQHHRVADGQRTVGLLGREPVHLGVGASVRAVRARPRSAGNATRRRRFSNCRAGGQRGDEAVGECRQRKSVGQQADAPAAAARAPAPAGWAAPPTARPPKARQAAAASSCRRLCLHFDLAEQNFAVAVADIGEASDPRRLDFLILQAEPAALGDVLRQYLAFDQRLAPSRKRRCQICREPRLSRIPAAARAPAYAKTANRSPLPTRTSKSRKAAA